MRLFWLLTGFVPLVAAQNTSKENEDQSLLWGTYRPNLYFGLRPRLPQSLMSGLMWWGTQDYASFGSQYDQLSALYSNNAYIRVSSVQKYGIRVSKAMGSTVIRGWNTTCAKEAFKC